MSAVAVGMSASRMPLPLIGGLPWESASELDVLIAGAAAAWSCEILHLVLGPLDLNLLGLEVHLNRVVLDITATSGPGNLLCAVAGLLDGTPTLTDFLKAANLLGRILTLLKL